MSALSSVLVKFTADISDLQSKIRQAMEQVSSTSKKVQERGSLMGRAFEKFGSVAKKAIAGISTALGGLSAWKGIEINANLEQVLMSFETLLGSAEKAQKMVSDLRKFAIETPFEFDGIVKSARLMLAMGFTAKEVMPYLYAIGDAVAAVGGNEETLNGVVVAISQMKTKGKISAEEMNQLAERGIGGWEILSQKMGKSKKELMELASQGKLMADDVIPLLIEGMGDKFGGAMQKQAKTFNGMMAQLRDGISLLLGTAFEPLFNRLKEMLPNALKFVDTFNQGLRQGGWAEAIKRAFPPNIANTILVIGNAVKNVFNFIKNNWTAIQAALVGLGAAFAVHKIMAAINAFKQMGGAIGLVARAMNILRATFLANPFALIIGAVAIAAYLIITNWDKIKNFLVTTWNNIKNTALSVWDGIKSKIETVINRISYIFNTVKGVIVAVWDVLTGGPLDVEMAIEFLGQIFGEKANYIISVLTFLREGISNVWNVIKSYFVAVGGTILAAVKSVWNIIKTIFAAGFLTIVYLCTDQTDKIKQVWSAAFEKIKHIVSSFWNKVKNLWVNFGNALVNLAKWLWDKAKVTWNAGVNFIKNAFSKAMDWLSAKASSAWNSIYNFFASAPSRIENYLSKVKSNISKKASEMASAAIDMGKNVVKGFVNGLESLGGWLEQKVKGLFKSAVDRAKKFLGIASPSKLFAQFGKWTAQGFAVGVYNGADMVESSVLNMVKTASNTASAATITPSVSSELARQAYTTKMARYTALATTYSGAAKQTVIEVPVTLNGREIARVVAPYMDQELARREALERRAQGRVR